jgi:ABC-type polysaccharide/polyol phosphate export permease
VNKKINPMAHQIGGLKKILVPKIVLSHLNTLIPVGIAIIIVAAVKYARVSRSIPTVNM